MTRVQSATRYGSPGLSTALLTCDLQEDFEPAHAKGPVSPTLFPWRADPNWVRGSLSATWLTPTLRDASRREVATALDTAPMLRVGDLGWTREEAAETHYRLLSFKEDWNAQGMEAYDAL